MTNLINLLLLYGGKSGEHEISLRSAASVLANLDPSRYRIIPVGIDKEGRCFVNDYQELLTFRDSLPVQTSKSQLIEGLLSNAQLAIHADVVFPVLHGPLYEDGCLQGLLELANKAYVGCDVLSSALGMDKDMARRVAAGHDIQATHYRVVSSCRRWQDIVLACREAAEALGWPLFVKPCSMGSSVGIHKVGTLDELLAAVKDASRYDVEVLIEAFIKGREVELAVLESLTPGEPPLVSIPGEIKVNHHDGFYSYNAKYSESNQTDLLIPADMSENLRAALQQAASVIFTALKCKGLARVDFFIEESKEVIYFNEINTMPGFTTISMYPKLWQASGIPYQALLDQLIEVAMMHHQNREKLITNYQ